MKPSFSIFPLSFNKAAFWRKLPKYIFEFLGLLIFYSLVRILPFAKASRFSGWLFRSIGMFLKTSKTGYGNLGKIFPHLSFEEKKEIMEKVWDNIGRTIGEYLHLHKTPLFGEKSPVEVEGMEHLDALMSKGGPSILFLGHMANWEYGTLIPLAKGMDVVQVARTPNNPFAAWMMYKIIGRFVKNSVSKGHRGTREMIKALQEGRHLAMLVDQKMNEGVEMPFLGYPAMTSSGIARLAIHFNCPILPVRVERLEGEKCRVTYEPSFMPPQEGTTSEKTDVILKRVNGCLERWIKERPEQWLWIHRRWPWS